MTQHLMIKIVRTLIGGGLVLAAASAPVMAQPWHHGDIHRFHERDIHAWRSGSWYHGHYGGRLGWWWIVGGVYYFYPGPVYPYPDPYVPGPVIVAPQAAAPASVWYYCETSKAYYPYVAECADGWKTVPVTPQSIESKK